MRSTSPSSLCDPIRVGVIDLANRIVIQLWPTAGPIWSRSAKPSSPTRTWAGGCARTHC
jgi:hypothetical protein